MWAYEIRNSVLIGVRRGCIDQAGAGEFLSSLAGLNIRLADPVSYDAVFALAETNRPTVYDAAYLDLPIRKGALLASLDDALCKAAVKAGRSLFQIAEGV